MPHHHHFFDHSADDPFAIVGSSIDHDHDTPQDRGGGVRLDGVWIGDRWYGSDNATGGGVADREDTP